MNNKLKHIVKKDKVNSNCCMEDYVENILAENLTLKRKLESKCQALSILNISVSDLKLENDRLKSFTEELKQQRQQVPIPEPDVQCAEPSRVGRVEVELLRQKLRDALGDVQALRAKVTNCKNLTDPGGQALQREEQLVERLEQMQREKSQLEADLQVVLDEKEELVKERDAYKCKLHRLNHECNVLLKGNTSGVIDLDALVTENRFLQERLQCAQEECGLAKQVAEKYKGMVQSRRQKVSAVGDKQDSSNGMLLSQKQVKELLDNCGRTDIPGAENSSPELRSLCFALLDSLGDKTLALSHQKRANRILAANIAELQARLERGHTHQVSSPSAMLLQGYKLAEEEHISPEISSTDDNNVGKSEPHI